MRLLRFFLLLAFAAWALATLYAFAWFRERYGRGGPIPVSQARMLLSPRREWIHPVVKTFKEVPD